MITIKDILNSLAFLITIFLISYGAVKGYDFIEITMYNLYFIIIIITQTLNLIQRKESDEP